MAVGELPAWPVASVALGCLLGAPAAQGLDDWGGRSRLHQVVAAPCAVGAACVSGDTRAHTQNSECLVEGQLGKHLCRGAPLARGVHLGEDGLGAVQRERQAVHREVLLHERHGTHLAAAVGQRPIRCS